MKCITIFAGLCMFFISGIKAQNLLANSGFEHKNICVEYHITCAPEAWFRIPLTEIKSPGGRDVRSHSGVFFQNIVFENVKVPVAYRSFIYTKILCPLVQDNLYEITLWVNAINSKFEHVDIWLSDIEPTRSKKTLREVEAQIILKPENITGEPEQGWLRLSYKYKANGNERFLMIGNFSKDGLVNSTQTNDADIIYQLDDIELRPIVRAAACDEYDAVRRQLYDMNYRHTNNVFVDDIPLKQSLIEKQAIPIDTLRKKEITWVIVDTPPSLKQKFFANDTLILPDILFHFNSSIINPSFANILDSVVQKIELATFKKIKIIGHTDNEGASSYNLKLSFNRAASVKNYLLTKHEFSGDNIATEGKGESQPIAENTSATGRQKNRRVELILLK